MNDREHEDSQQDIHGDRGRRPSPLPEEPGYPAHPELAREPSTRARQGKGHDAHAGHEAHSGHEMRDEHDMHRGHDRHAGHSVAMFRDRFWLSFALTIPILVWGHMLPRL